MAAELPIPDDEDERLRVVASYQVLDTPAEKDYDAVVALAARLCEVPIALVSLIDADRQWFKARHGLDMPQTPREHAFCAHTIMGTDPLIAPDATQDPRFRDNPFVQGETHIRFYAGVPLLSREERQPLGTLCVVDVEPRELSTDTVALLEGLARQVENCLELRRSALAFDAFRRNAEQERDATARAFSCFMQDLAHPLEQLSAIGATLPLEAEEAPRVGEAITTAAESLRHAVDDLSKLTPSLVEACPQSARLPWSREDSDRERLPVMQIETRVVEGRAQIAHANRWLLARLGYEEHELRHRPLAELYTPESTALLEGSGFQKALEGRFLAEERELIAKDGSVVPVLTMAAPLSSHGETVGTEATFIETTSRRHLEAWAREQAADGGPDEALKLTGEIAHELNNALTIVVSAASNIREALEAEHGIVIPDFDALLVAASRATEVGKRLLSRSAHRPPEGFDEPPEALSASAGRILVVDDELQIRRMLRRVLARRGYSVEVASDGQDALRRLEESAFDLLVTDVVMPGLSGPELWASLPTSKRPGAVLFISGFMDQPVIRESVGNSGAAYLQKPFGMDAFTRTVDGLLLQVSMLRGA